MRIVITKNGKKIVHELEDESPNEYDKQKSKYNQSSSMSKLPIINTTNEELFKKYSAKNNEFLHQILRYRDTFQIKRSNSVIDKRALDSFYNRDESKINMNELIQAKKVKISQPKIIMTQAFIDKYDNYDSNFKKNTNKLSNGLDNKEESLEKRENYINIDDKKIIDINTNSNIKTNMNLDSNYGINSSLFSNKTNKINLGKIISRNNLENLRKHISKFNKGPDDNRIFLDEQNIRSFNFRSRYENKQATEEDMNLILNYSINPDKHSIIRYFQQEKNISPQYFENLLKYDESKMYKLNKICQMIFENKDNERKFNNFKFLKFNRNKDKFNREKEGQNLKDLQGIIKKSNSILDDYTTLINHDNFWRKHAYKDDIIKIKEKYWNKYKVDRFLKNKQRIEISKLANNTKNNINSQFSKKLFSSKSSPDLFS